MTIRLRSLWHSVRSSLWFVPTVMTVGAIGASFALVALDHAFGDEVYRRLGVVYSGGAEGARAVLSAIATSMIAVAGVTFSITIVALTLASQQYGPRLLGNFLRDFGNQVVLGTFIATFLYCLLVLRTIRGGDGDQGFVPQLSVTFGVVLAIASLGILIYFIHHVSASMLASRIVASVAHDLVVTIDRLFPDRIGEAHPEPVREPGQDADGGREAPATCSGYVQGVDGDVLLGLASRADVVIRIDGRPGDFVAEGRPLATVVPGERADDDLLRRIAGAFLLGPGRTASEDVGYSIDRLVEVAARALSPGVNDPFTAMACVDQLGAGLMRLLGRTIPSPYRRDDGGRLRLVARPIDAVQAIGRAFDPIRLAARGDLLATVHLLVTLEAIAPCARRPEDRAAIERQAALVEQGAREAFSEEEDRTTVATAYRAVRAALARGPRAA